MNPRLIELAKTDSLIHAVFSAVRAGLPWSDETAVKLVRTMLERDTTLSAIAALDVLAASESIEILAARHAEIVNIMHHFLVTRPPQTILRGE